MKTKKILFFRIIPSLFRHFFSPVILIFVLSSLPSVVHGAEVTLAWYANTESDLAGYNIYYGTASGDYSDSIDVGDVTEYTVTGLDDGGTYYFAATAYDEDDNESAYSEELVHTCSYNKTKPHPIAEIIGTWSSGIWYWDVAASKWTQMNSDTPDGDIAVGDFTGDGKADVASCWWDGLWYQDGATLGWTMVWSEAPDKVTAGDVTGN
jgi:hypothetical protein